MQTMKQLIETGFFPTDDEGRALVPIVGGADYGGNATIFATNAPGVFPIIGTGPFGYADMWDENGSARPEVCMNIPLYGAEVLACSLCMPEVEEVTFRVIIDDEGYVVDTYDADDNIEPSDIPEGGQVVEATGFRYMPAVVEPTADYLFVDVGSVSDEDDTNAASADDLAAALGYAAAMPSRLRAGLVGSHPEVPFGGMYGMPIGVNYSHGIRDRSR